MKVTKLVIAVTKTGNKTSSRVIISVIMKNGMEKNKQSMHIGNVNRLHN